MGKKSLAPLPAEPMKIPVIELADCTRCGVCVSVCPDVFLFNDAGYVSIVEMAQYPEAEVDEAIKNCPADCIKWEIV